MSAQKVLQGSETETRELLGGMEDKSVSPDKGSLICPPGKPMIFFTKNKNESTKCQDKNELVAKPGSWDGGEGADQVGLDSRGRLEGEDPSSPEEIDRDLGGDLAGQEEPEAGVGLQRVQLLLQGHQPAGSQVHVLQHHPTTAFHRRVDRLKNSRKTD